MEENIVLAILLMLPVVSASALFWIGQRGRNRTDRAGFRWPAVLGINVTVFVFLVSLSGLLAESYFRFLCDTTDALGFTKISQRWYQRHWHDNAFGCRDDVEYPLALSPGKIRISFVGDSFTAGHGLSRVEDRFANRIRRAHPDWEIQLLAQPGFDTGNELQALAQALDHGYQVNQVVLVYCLNDVTDMFPEWAEKVLRLRQESEQANWIVRHSYCANTLYYRFNRHVNEQAKSYFAYIQDGYRGSHWEEQKRRIRELRDLVIAHGGHFSVVTFPLMHALGPHYEYTAAHQQLALGWRELQVPALDLLSIYQGYPPGQVTVSRFDGHPNEFANALAARAIEAFLEDQLKAQGKQP